MRFKGLDLNLLVALEAMIQERSVSRAAERLNFSQPAVSAALSRLRDYFKDELLVAVGRNMVPTAFAESLRPLITEVLAGAERLVASSSLFDPTSSQRRFRIAASDYITTVLITPLLPLLEQEAPNVQIEVIATGTPSSAEFERGEIDLLITPVEYVAPGHPTELLFEEQHVVLGWSENPVLRGPITQEVFLDQGHIGVKLGVTIDITFAERHLAFLGSRRRIEVVAPSFSSVPWMLPRTYRLAVIQERMARAFLGVLPLAIQPLPFSVPMMREMAQYHSTRGEDVGIKWLLERVRYVAEQARRAR